MTVEQRTKRLSEINHEMILLRGEQYKLEQEQTLYEQQQCLKWVGRAFKNNKQAILITSVPPIEYTMNGEHFNQYQFPCIKVVLEGYSPPVFDDTYFIGKKISVGSAGSTSPYEEISFSEFQEIFNKRTEDILKLAATAKMRQNGKIVTSTAEKFAKNKNFWYNKYVSGRDAS